jgi:hypothetical protein
LVPARIIAMYALRSMFCESERFRGRPNDRPAGRPE